MFSIRASLKLSALVAFAALSACGVSAGGAIPCADDSSCPTDYPRCDPAQNKCVAGTPTAGPASTVIVGVVGRDPSSTAPVRGTVTFSVVARSTSGVKGVAINATAGSVTRNYPALPGQAGPLYTIAVPTDNAATGLPDGTATFTSVVTPGDSTVAAPPSPPMSLTIDNTRPTLSATASIPDARSGSMVLLDVTASEALASLTAVVTSSNGNVVGNAVEVSAPTGLVHHLGFAAVGGLDSGTYTLSVSCTDLAGNPVLAPLVKTFAVRVQVPLTDLTVANSQGVTEAGIAAASTGSLLKVTLNLPAGLTLPAGASPVFTLTRPDGTTLPLTASGSGSAWTASYLVLAGDPAGLGTLTASAVDTAGNQSSLQKQFLIDRTAPSIAGLTVLPQSVHAGSTVTLTGVATKRLQSAGVSTSTSDVGVCTFSPTSSAPTVTCTITVTNGPNLAATTASLLLTDPLGNASPSTGPSSTLFQTSYNVLPVPVATGLTAGAPIITLGTTTTLLPSFSGGSAVITADVGANPGPVTNGTLVNVAPGLGTTNYTLTVTSPVGDSVPTGTSVLVVNKPVAAITVDKPNISTGASAILHITFAAGTATLVGVPADLTLPGTLTSGMDIVIAPANTTTYTLTVTNAANTATTASLFVSVGQQPITTLGVLGPQPSIPGQSVNHRTWTQSRTGKM